MKTNRQPAYGTPNEAIPLAELFDDRHLSQPSLCKFILILMPDSSVVG